MNGLILFAHGARDPAWALPFEAMLERLQALQPTCPARLAFLEFMQPSLAQAATQLVEEGCKSIGIFPLFLGAGGHVRRDLPAQLAQLQTQYPAVTWQLHASAGESPLLVECLARIAADLASPHS